MGFVHQGPKEKVCINISRSNCELGGNLISWSAKEQPTISRSSFESRYRAMANTSAEVVWITHPLQELHALPHDHSAILCDNRNAYF